VALAQPNSMEEVSSSREQPAQLRHMLDRVWSVRKKSPCFSYRDQHGLLFSYSQLPITWGKHATLPGGRSRSSLDRP
jgi:hypothetical protein